MKNVRWKINVDLRMSYTYVQLQQQVIHEKFTQVQQNMTLSNDITITKSHLEILEYANETSLSKYIREMNDKHNIIPNLMQYIVKSVPDYSNILKKCMLRLHEKQEILNYSDQEELLNKMSELVSKCRNVNKFPLSNCKSNDYCINQLIKYY